MSLHRTLADWPIVAAAWLITLLAAVLLSAGPIYSSAASVAGLRRTLADAPATQTNVQVSLYGAQTDAATVDSRVRAELQRATAPLGSAVQREWRSGTFALPDQPTGQALDLAFLGYLDGLAGHASLTAGEWPVDAGGPADALPVVVVDTVAGQLHLSVGDRLSLTNRLDSSVVVPVRVSGIFHVTSDTDPFWNGDQQLITGLSQTASFRTFGPFFTTSDALLRRLGGTLERMQWTAVPDFGRLTVDDAATLRNRLGALPDRLQATTGQTVGVQSGLPAILADAERSLLVSRTGVLLLMAQLAILAAYAIILTGSLLVDHRRVETALLRSRGAGPMQVALLALAEGLLLATPAVLLAPWLAVAALGLLNVVGPLADLGLDIVPTVSLDGYVAAALAGIACVVLLVLPAVFAARRFATAQGELSRQETRTFGQRMGVDLALLIVTGIALWQLRLYGAPLTRTVQGSLGLDPLLVAAPGIGLLAGGVLALRILPLLAQGMERVVSRGRALVGSMGSRQLARRPLRYTRSALLLMLAISMGVFALSYASTWSTSQHDQAQYQAGADVRVTPGLASEGPPAWALPAAYAGLAGQGNVSPVERSSYAISFAATTGDLLAIDAGTAPAVVLLRPDQASPSLDSLMQALRAGRPAPQLAVLPADATTLRVVPRLDISSLVELGFDPKTGQTTSRPLDAATVASIRLSASAVVRDARGLLYRVESDLVARDAAATGLMVPLEPAGAAGAAGSGANERLEGPVQLAGLGITVWLPGNSLMLGGIVGVREVSAGAGASGPRTPVPLTGTAWSAQLGLGRQALSPVPADQVEGTAVRVASSGGRGAFLGNDGAPAARISFLPAAIASLDAAVPVIANQAFLTASGAAPGETISATLDGHVRSLRIAGTVDSFPTTNPGRPLLVLDEPTLGLLRLQATGEIRSPDEWWMSSGSGNADALAATLRGDRFGSALVTTLTDRIQSLSADPVALGIVGALMLGAVATGLFAIVGLAVSAAVSARQRRTEFALLRALGLSGRQLSSWLWLENGTLVLVSLAAGMGLGLLIGWVVLPFVTVTQQATAPVPPVIVHVPWDRILLLDLVSVIALGAAMLVIGGVLRRLGVGGILRMGED